MLKNVRYNFLNFDVVCRDRLNTMSMQDQKLNIANAWAYFLEQSSIHEESEQHQSICRALYDCLWAHGECLESCAIREIDWLVQTQRTSMPGDNIGGRIKRYE